MGDVSSYPSTSQIVTLFRSGYAREFLAFAVRTFYVDKNGAVLLKVLKFANNRDMLNPSRTRAVYRGWCCPKVCNTPRLVYLIH